MTYDATKLPWSSGSTTIISPPLNSTTTKPPTPVVQEMVIQREWFVKKKRAMKRITKALEQLGLDYDVAYHPDCGYDITSMIRGLPVEDK